MKKNIHFIALYLCCFSFLSTNTTIAQSNDSSSFKFSGYIDAYYARYSDSVGTNNYSKFPVISPRDNAFGLNLFQLTGQYSAEKMRAIATIHYGDIATSAWSPVLNLIQEANVGFKLSKKVWIDAGLFKTHIGTEALLPKDNIASSLSAITFYEPWFQSGIKVSYIHNEKLMLCFHLLNGYNTFVETNSKKSIGIAASYIINEKASIGYYNLMGDEMPDNLSSSHFRLLNNLVFNYQFNPKLKGVAGVDLITQQNSAILDPNKTAAVYSAIVTLRYQLRSKLGVYGRFEMFNDADGVLTGVINDAQGNPTGYKLTDYTLGAEYKPSENSYLRLEGRMMLMDSDQKIFRTDGSDTNIRTEIMMNVGIWF